jgi:hypothetical protein
LFVRFDHVARGIIKRVLRDPERGPGLIVKGKRISCPPHHDCEHAFPLIRSLRASAQRSTSVLFSFVLSLLIMAGSFAVRQSKTILAVSGAWRRLTKTKAIKPANCFSDNFGHWNCVILRESCKYPDLHFPL